jgi:hypothetical protein
MMMAASYHIDMLVSKLKSRGAKMATGDVQKIILGKIARLTNLTSLVKELRPVNSTAPFSKPPAEFTGPGSVPNSARRSRLGIFLPSVANLNRRTFENTSVISTRFRINKLALGHQAR